jgi:hypothetical protein
LVRIEEDSEEFGAEDHVMAVLRYLLICVKELDTTGPVH